MGKATSIWGCLECTVDRLQVVEVLRPDGKYEEFADPLDVAALMRMHPDHLVVHCSSLDRPVGALSKIRIMRPDQELALGHSYFLHPIPPRYRKKTMFDPHSNSSPLPKSPLGLPGDPETEGLLRNNPPKSRKLKKLSGKRAKRLATLQDLCANLLQPLQPVPVTICDSSGGSILSCSRRRASLLALSKEIVESPSAPLLDSRMMSFDTCEEKPRTSFGFNGWRPGLDSIPESPPRSFGGDLRLTNTMRYHVLVDRCPERN